MQWIRMQWAITVGLAPAALLLFGQVSVAGPLANAVAIPVVSVVVTPLALLAAVLPCAPILRNRIVAGRVAACVSRMVRGAAGRAVAAARAAGLGCGARRSPARSGCSRRAACPGAPAGLALMAPAFSLAPRRARGGRGLDHGARRRTGARGAGAHGEPHAALRRRAGVRARGRQRRAHRRADAARRGRRAAGHDDRQPRGHGSPRRRAERARDARGARAASSLRAGSRRSIRWCPRRVAAPPGGAGNGTACASSSCIRRRAGNPRVATTRAACCGWKPAEARCCSLGTSSARRKIFWPGTLHSRRDVLLVPHHGSRTSSSEAFIAAVGPRWAVVPAGYRNRFGHPAREVLARYEGAKVSVLRTDLGGAVSVVLNRDATQVRAQRTLRPRYWRLHRHPCLATLRRAYRMVARGSPATERSGDHG